VKDCEFLSIDLFAGAGGMTQGFKKRGFKPLFANDHEKPALESFAHNHPEAITSSDPVESLNPSEVREHLKLAKGDLDVLLGGPPCQGFSTYGKRNPKDQRNQLYKRFLEFIEEFRPKVFVMENVVGILSLEQGNVVDDIVSRAERLGYRVSVIRLDAVAFGVPQFRKRVFILGGANQQKLDEPLPTHGIVRSKKSKPAETNYQTSLFLHHDFCLLKPAITVSEAIADLPREVFPPSLTHKAMPYPPWHCLTVYQHELRHGADAILHHSAKRMLGTRRLRLALMRPGDYGTKIRSRLKEGGLPNELIDELLISSTSFRDLRECRREDRAKEEELRRILQQGYVDIEEVLQSIDSGGFANKYRRLEWNAPSHTLVAHMARDCSDFIHPEIDRFISVREAARLQSFPDSYYFHGSQFQQFRQIGNAVPPKLAEAIASEVVRFLGVQTQEVVSRTN
jgi:DNA (cytosine-5)-methyltransferase 1